MPVPGVIKSEAMFLEDDGITQCLIIVNLQVCIVIYIKGLKYMGVYFLLDVEPSMGEGHIKLQHCYKGWLVVEARLGSSVTEVCGKNKRQLLQNRLLLVLSLY